MGLNNSFDQIVTNASMTATVNSLGMPCQQLVLASIQAEWTGAPVGTLHLEISNDEVPYAPGNQANAGANVVNWSVYTGSTTAVSGPGNFLWNCVFVGYSWMRLVYTPTSGTGTINAYFTGKG